MITITRSGCRVDASREELEALRRRFEEDHYVVLPSLLEPCLLDSTLEALDKAEFAEIPESPMYKYTYRGLELRDPALSVRLMFLFNDPAFFRLIEQIAGCAPINELQGRVISLLPDRGHFFDWHHDGLEYYFQTPRNFNAADAMRVARRIVAMRLNLSRKPYEGGRLQFRDPKEPSRVTECSDATCGNVVVFKARDILHRNSEVHGAPRTTFSGFFLAADPVEPPRSDSRGLARRAA